MRAKGVSNALRHVAWLQRADPSLFVSAKGRLFREAIDPIGPEPGEGPVAQRPQEGGGVRPTFPPRPSPG
jgi:hypothetical protein